MEGKTVDGVFSERLKQLRAQRKLSQAQFAKKLNLSQSAVAGWEKCRAEPNYRTLRSIADAMGVSLDYLLGRTENPMTSAQSAQKPYLEVTPFERDLMISYRRLSETEQAMVCRLVGLEHPAESRLKAKKSS